MNDDGRTHARPSRDGAGDGASDAGDAGAVRESPASAPTAEETSAQIAGLASDPKAFKHRISADASISGRIHFPGNARVDGRLKGEIRADALLVVGEMALLEADVRAERLLLRGTVRGSITCPGFAELAPGSVVEGQVAATTLLVRPGARIDGVCRVGIPIAPAPAVAMPSPAARTGAAGTRPSAAQGRQTAIR